MDVSDEDLSLQCELSHTDEGIIFSSNTHSNIRVC
jgi:hypothetical protein